MRQVMDIPLLSKVNSGLLITAQMSDDAREFTIVNLDTIPHLAHLIPMGQRHWLVYSQIHLRTQNEVY